MGARDCTDMYRSLPEEHPESDWSIIFVTDVKARSLM